MSTPIYWKAICPKCGWIGMSNECKGGDAIADTGDYSDIVCPECFKKEEWIAVEEEIEVTK